MLNEIFLSENWILTSIFILLIIISVASWYVIFHKTLFFLNQEKSLNNQNLNSETLNSLKQAFKTIENKAFSSEIIDRKLNIIFEELKHKINFGQTFLASIANLSPFIGLFGTVLGVYFALIDISKLGNASISTVAGPIGEALIATAIGLWCAIPAAFAYNFFAKKSNNLLKKIKLLTENELINKGL